MLRRGCPSLNALQLAVISSRRHRRFRLGPSLGQRLRSCPLALPSFGDAAFSAWCAVFVSSCVDRVHRGKAMVRGQRGVDCSVQACSGGDCRRGFPAIKSRSGFPISRGLHWRWALPGENKHGLYRQPACTGAKTVEPGYADMFRPRRYPFPRQRRPQWTSARGDRRRCRGCAPRSERPSVG